MLSPADIVVRGRSVEVSARFREHVNDKLSRADRFGVSLGRIDVEVSQERNPRQAERAYEVELTCRGKGHVIRAEASAPDKYAALDVAYGRLEERLRRAADRKRYSRHGRGATLSAAEVSNLPLDLGPIVDHRPVAAPAPDVESEDDPSVVFEEGPVVVREKTHGSTPMTVEQALEAMELVGHDFFLFSDSSCGRPSVVYRRKGFDYGLIRLDVTT